MHMLAAAVDLSVIAARSPLVDNAVVFLRAVCLVHLGVRAVLTACRVA
ncbi:hypothetical protein [Streptomyces albidoflavus]|nr:hypothetical protein [Streptomyces albidoflavus]